MPKVLTTKLISNAIKHVNTAADKEIYKVLDAARNIFVETRVSTWLDQLISSRTGRKKPMKTGIKQTKKAAALLNLIN